MAPTYLCRFPGSHSDPAHVAPHFSVLVVMNVFLGLVVLGLAIGALVVGAYLSAISFHEAMEKVAPQFRGTLTARFAADPYIWSASAPRALRRRYVLGGALFLLGLGSLLLLVWLAKRDPVVLCFLIGIVAAALLLTWRVLRYGL
jgi:hypothetical protein